LHFGSLPSVVANLLMSQYLILVTYSFSPYLACIGLFNSGIKTVRILSFYNLQLQSTLVSLCNKYIYAFLLPFHFLIGKFYSHWITLSNSTSLALLLFYWTLVHSCLNIW
jgi:hypothetical protein